MNSIEKWKKASEEYTEKYNNKITRFFAGELTMLHLTKDGFYTFGDQKGFIQKKEKWEAIKKVVDSFYDVLSDQEIEEYNNSILRDLGLLDEPRSTSQAPKKKIKKQPGFIYFIRADNGLTKIGKTKNIKQRLDHFTAKLPYKLELVHSIETEDTKSLEEFFHNKFSEKRKRGEWFELNQSDLEEIQNG